MVKALIFDDRECVIDVKDYVQDAEDFAERLLAKPDYYNYMVNCRKAKPDKLKKDNRDSKLTEFAVDSFLVKNFNFPDLASNPDLKIYEKNKKSWDADLVYPETKWTDLSDAATLNVAVKSCSTYTVKNYGESYTFNIGTSNNPNTIDVALSGTGKGGLDDLFCSGADEDVVSFVIYDDKAMTCEIRGFVNWSQMKYDGAKAFGHPKLERLKGIKAVVYKDYLKGLK